MNIQVSVCIPFYNVEKYIVQCVESLFSQTMQSGIEFIFVNDCSYDKSEELIRECLKKYPFRNEQVYFIKHEKNLGITAARESALKATHGEYVIFCDSDDWVDKNYYQSLYQKAKENNYDCVLGNYFSEKANGVRSFHEMDQTKTTNELYHSILSGSARGVFWNKLFHTKIIHSSYFCSLPEFYRHEDIIKIISVLVHSDNFKFGYATKGAYHYRVRPNSISTKKCEKKEFYQSIVDAIDHLVDLLPEQEFESDFNYRKRWQLLRVIDEQILSATEYHNLWKDAQKGVLFDKRFSLLHRMCLFLATFAYLPVTICCTMRKKIRILFSDR